MLSALAFMAISCVILAIDFAVEPSTPTNIAVPAVGMISVAGRASVMMSTPAANSTLSAHEIAHMRYMREEEKLAHDVYQHFANIWGTPIFGKIAQAEQRHTDAVLRLLNTYSLPDPSAHKDAGEFTDPQLASLYAALIEKGGESPANALMVGGLIEEVDIADLENATASTQRPDIIRVYTTIHRGSRNHLRSFAKALGRMGIAYIPQKLSLAEVQNILNTPMETGPPL